MLKKFFKQHRQFILYCTIGINGVLVEMATFWFVYAQLDLDKQIANAASVITSVSHNYLLNYRFTFGVKDHFWQRYATYYAVAMVGLLISSIILAVCVDVLGWQIYIAKFASIVVVTLTQFNLNRLITFRSLARAT